MLPLRRESFASLALRVSVFLVRLTVSQKSRNFKASASGWYEINSVVSLRLEKGNQSGD